MTAPFTNISPATFLHHYQAIAEAAAAQKEAAAALALAKKEAKEDGVDLKAVRMVAQLAELDADGAQALLRRFGDYARWLQMPLGTQGDLWSDAPWGADVTDSIPLVADHSAHAV